MSLPTSPVLTEPDRDGAVWVVQPKPVNDWMERLTNMRRRTSVWDVPVPVSVLILVGFVVFAGYMVFGVTGFGASPITIPVLVHLLPLTFVLALAAILDLSSALVLGFHTRRQADAGELAALVPFTLVGLTLGVTLLVHLHRHRAVHHRRHPHHTYGLTILPGETRVSAVSRSARADPTART